MSAQQALELNYGGLYVPSLHVSNQSETSSSEIAAVQLFKLASYLTDPICKSHECFRRIQVVDALNAHDYKVTNLARKLFLAFAVMTYGFIAVFTAAPAIGVRSLGIYLQKNPFIQESRGVGKQLSQDREFSLLSWNVCCVGAGYTISDGGVVPWSFRVDQIVDKILEKDADVNCLYETFDIQSAFTIRDKLASHGYTHFYYNIGPKAVGVSSGILVASKYKITKPEFLQFPLELLVGRTKNAAKGVFSFCLQSGGRDFAQIHTTHLQHSEQPAFPTEEEIAARKGQMQMIVDKVDSMRQTRLCTVVTGDLNLDDEEYRKSSWHNWFQKGDEFQEKTWGGDSFCANLTGKPISHELNLDHTMLVEGSARSIRTTLVKTGYDSNVFKKEALSDHEGLFSRIVL